MAKQQRRVLFSGRVQGVGFRFTACRVAAGYDVSGYVRNLPSGQVECVVEGEEVEINAFIDALAGAMSGYVTDQTQQVAPYTGKFSSFTVGY